MSYAYGAHLVDWLALFGVLAILAVLNRRKR